MFYRKIYAAFFTSILAVIGLNIIEPVSSQDDLIFIGFAVYSFYVVPIVFIYGGISSIISDTISFKSKKYKEIKSLALHILFGLCFLLPYNIFYEHLSLIEIVTDPFTILCFVNSIIFFMIDRLLRKWIY